MVSPLCTEHEALPTNFSTSQEGERKEVRANSLIPSM